MQTILVSWLILQHLLEIVEQWLQWSGMKAKICKCHCMALQGSTGKLIDPQLRLAGKTIPFIANNSIKFLGMRIQVPHDSTATKETLVANLKRMLQAVDKCPLICRQKLRLYKAGVCPRLSWLLLIEELPITWVERELEATATRFLKKWAGLAKSTNVALLYLPTKRGGLNLPALTSLYKRLQVSRQSQLLMSPDGSVRLLAERNLQHELSMTRKKFKPAVTVRNAMVEDPSRSRKALSAAVRRKVQEEDDAERLSQLRKLEKQGQMVSSVDGDEVETWANTIQSLPSQLMRFTLNAAMDTLPHNANLHLWGKKETDACPLCGERQTLIHVLNCCRVARELRRYNQRHDGVLGILADLIKEKLPLSTHISADLGSDYNFPQHITPTDLKPDIVWWKDEKKVVQMLELTIPFETTMADAAERKETRYEELIHSAQQASYTTTLITVEVGARGVPHMTGLKTLKHKLKLTSTDFSSLLDQVSRKAVEGSFAVWCSRNRTTT